VSGTRAPTRVSGAQVAASGGGRLGFVGTRRLWVLVGLLVLACAGLALALVLDDDESNQGRAAPARSPAEPGARTVGFPVRVGDAPSAVAVGPENVWVLSEGEGTVSRVDPTRNEIVGPSVDVGGRPRYMVIASGSLWVTNFDGHTVTRINPVAHRIQTRIRVGRSPWGLATAPGSVWVVNHDDDTVQQISTVDNSFVGPPIKVGQAPVNASFGYSSVWVANSQSDTVSRVDLRARAVVDSIPVGDHPEGLSVGADGIWVANLEDDTVSRIDPTKNRVVATAFRSAVTWSNCARKASNSSWASSGGSSFASFRRAASVPRARRSNSRGWVPMPASRRSIGLTASL
jgi:YVTN family beta-propeller protein